MGDPKEFISNSNAWTYLLFLSHGRTNGMELAVFFNLVGDRFTDLFFLFPQAQ